MVADLHPARKGSGGTSTTCATATGRDGTDQSETTRYGLPPGAGSCSPVGSSSTGATTADGVEPGAGAVGGAADGPADGSSGAGVQPATRSSRAIRGTGARLMPY